MSIELDAQDPWVSRGYGQASIEPGERPAVLVIDLQYAFTDPEFVFGGAELIERATVNTAELLHAARDADVPVYHTVVVWKDESELGHWTTSDSGTIGTCCCPRSGPRSSTERRSSRFSPRRSATR
jgi:nicotinamidase-related amidase